MGSRVHYAKKHEVEWLGGFFNWQNSEFADMLMAELPNSWVADDEQTAEIYRADAVAYIKKLEKQPEAINKHMTQEDDPCTNREVADVFKEILKSDDDCIRLEWF